MARPILIFDVPTPEGVTHYAFDTSVAGVDAVIGQGLMGLAQNVPNGTTVTVSMVLYTTAN